MLLEESQVFLLVVESGNISQAARELNITPSSASKRLRKLEERLGATLFYRNTRSISLTDAGKLYYEKIRPALDQAKAAEKAIMDLTNSPQGSLTIAAGAMFANQVLSKTISRFSSDYPDIAIEIRITDEPISLASQAFDICIQWGDLKDTQLIAKKLTSERVSLVSSPEYANANDLLKVPLDELAKHYISLTHSYASNTRKITQSIRHNESRQPQLKVNSVELSLYVALAGGGMCAAPRYACQQYIDEGKLIDLSHLVRPISIDAYAVFHTPPSQSEKFRTFLNYLEKDISEIFSDPS